jgi:hypothetical protein
MATSHVTDTIDIIDEAADDPPTDVEERRRLYKAARRLMISVETPHSASQRVYYGFVCQTQALSEASNTNL